MASRCKLTGDTSSITLRDLRVPLTIESGYTTSGVYMEREGIRRFVTETQLHALFDIAVAAETNPEIMGRLWDVSNDAEDINGTALSTRASD